VADAEWQSTSLSDDSANGWPMAVIRQ